MTLASHERSRCVNLTFHGVGPAPRRLDPGEQDVWLSTEQFESVLDAVADRGDVRITFDDGNSSDVEHALPALRARGLTATFFVVAGRLGAPGFLGEDDVRALSAHDMTIGSHGMWHRPWRGLREQELDEELLVSRQRLEQLVKRPVTDAACPFGSYDRKVLQGLRRVGYAHVFTSDRGIARSDRWLQARNTIRRGTAAPGIEEIAAGSPSLRRGLTRQAKLAVKRWR
jgi:peptidoglycan/xylan/chitin deacetylase (PgdA/CDA1 family)